jgi:hypothetical protein
MSDNWDIPPIPERGDESADDTYRMVGKALSEWENLEYTLAHLYAEMVGKRSQIVALQYYGAPVIGKEGSVGRIFTTRIAGLEQLAETFFVNNPHQNHEGEFARIADAAKRLADRRNEIAHGIVSPFKNGEYGLVPPLYSKTKFGEKNQPIYIYTATELERFALAFFELSKAVVLLRLRFARTQRAWQERNRSP